MANPAFEKISCFLFDMDGVLTDGTVLVLENGLQARRMSIKDGYALQLAVKRGYRVLVLSGASSQPVTDRLNKLGIREVHMGVTDKAAFVAAFLSKHALKAEEVLFMGDDIPDLQGMLLTGLPACPADAVADIKEAAIFISGFTGGAGCVRDVIERVLRTRGHWQHDEQVASR